MNLKIIQQIWNMSRYALFGLFLQACLSSILIASDSNAQRVSIEDILVNVNLTNVNLEDALNEIGNETDFHFAFNRDIINKKARITKNIKNNLLHLS